MAKYTPLAWEINVQPEGVVFDVGTICSFQPYWANRFEACCTLLDPRDARGIRYRLVTVLVFLVLAKLAGENHLRGIAQWVRRRAVLLASFLALAKVQAPHATTDSRILGRAVKIEDFERVSREFFAQQPHAGTSVQITLDGKTLRGTIPAGQSHGIHWLAAFLPDEGWVLFQVEVGSKENEIPAASRIVKCLDLWQHPCHLGTREHHHGRCPLGPTRAVPRRAPRGRGLDLDHQGQSAGNAPRHRAALCPRTRGERF